MCDVFERNEVEALLTKDFLAQSFEILLTQEQDTPSNRIFRLFCKYHLLNAILLSSNEWYCVAFFQGSAQTRISNHQKEAESYLSIIRESRQKTISNIELYYLQALLQHRMGNIRQRNICLKCAINAALPNEPRSLMRKGKTGKEFLASRTRRLCRVGHRDDSRTQYSVKFSIVVYK